MTPSNQSKGKTKRLTVAQKYALLKRQTEQAGMVVRELDGKLLVSRKRKKR
jgi:hypothetical protein